MSRFVLFLLVTEDDDEIRSLCGALAVVRLLVQTKISLLQLAKLMFGNVNRYFPLTYYSKIVIPDLKQIFNW